MRRRTALLLTPLVALAACGGGADDGAGTVAVVDVAGAALVEPSAELLVSAADTTVAATTARVATEITAQPAVGDAVTITGDGFVDLVTGDLSYTAHLGGLAATIDPAFAGWTDPQIVLIAGFVFFRLPATVTGEPDDAWIRFDTADVADGALLPDGMLPQTTDLLAALGDVAGEVVQGPTEELDGVEVTRYDATIALDDLGASDLAGLLALGEAPLTADVSVWIDGDARVRRVETTATTAIVTIRASVVFSDFGVSFDPQPPLGWMTWDEAVGTPTMFPSVGEPID
jgi:hypothetical protein